MSLVMVQMPSTRRKFAAVMFTDIVGFSKLAEKDEALALDLLDEQETLVRSRLRVFAGREIKTIGDAFMVEFPSAPESVRCGIEIQKAMRERNESVGEKRHLLLRIGIHAGDVVDRDGDLYGDGVNIAARVEPASPHGGVAVSESVRDLVVAAPDPVEFRKLPTRPLKNIGRTIELFRVVMPWEDGTESGSATATAGTGEASSAEGGPSAPSLADQWFSGLDAEGGTDGGEVAGRGLAPAREDGPGTAAAVATAPAPTETPSARPARPAPRPAAPNRVAVIPLVNASGDPADEFIAAGLSEDVVRALSFVGGLEAISWNSVALSAGMSADAGGAGARLGAGTVLRGSAEITGGSVRIALECLSVAGGTVHWKREFSGDIRGLDRVLIEIARETARVVGANLQDGEVSRIGRLGTGNPQARINCLRGQHSLLLGGIEDAQAARDRFAQAVQCDNDFAFAHIGLALSFLRLGMSGRFPANQMLMNIVPGSMQAAARAVECGRLLADSHVVQGMVRLGLTYDIAGAEQELRQALHLKEASAEAHLWHALALAASGRFDECTPDLNRAHALDPASADVAEAGALIAYLARRYKPAISVAEWGLGSHPSSWHLRACLGLARAETGDTAAAMDCLQKAVDLSGSSPMAMGLLGSVQGRSGRGDEARAVLGQLKVMAGRRFVSSYAPALVHVGLGDKVKACELFAEAHEEQLNWLVFLNLSPLVDPLRGEPAYESLVERCGLASLAAVA